MPSSILLALLLAPTLAACAPRQDAAIVDPDLAGARASTGGRDPRIPPTSGDYSAALADSAAFMRGEISFAALRARVVARHLPPHPLGDAYLMMVPPAPPPPDVFDPMLMPDDWEGTFGEIAMTMFAGDITREQYDRLHRAAHPRCK